MPYFDFHIHPTLKTLFSADDPQTGRMKLSPYGNIDTRKIRFMLRWCSEIELILCSQGNYSQILKNQVRMIGIALFIPDTALIDNKLIKDAAKKDLKDYMSPDQINKLITGNPFQILLNEDIPVITKPDRFLDATGEINVLKKPSDFKPNGNTINCFFTVEGVHTLCNKPFQFDFNTIKQNLEALLRITPILSINLTHLQQSEVCNHAFGIQILNNLSPFLPKGNGITRLGYKLINLFTDKGIFVDIKHMSLNSRLRLYAYRKHNGLTDPLICTHAGLTGISYQDIKDYVRDKPRKKEGTYMLNLGKAVKYGKPPRPAFNVSSINLFDEDIVEILQSSGMIGLSLDKRILGFQDFRSLPPNDEYPVELEYVSEHELTIYLGTGKKAKVGKAFDAGKCLTMKEMARGGEVDPLMSKYHLKYFMQQIVHILEVARMNQMDLRSVMHQICIGSDFDGIINPIWTCNTMDELHSFEQHFKQDFERFCKDSNVSLPANFSVNSFARNLFYENGKNFVLSSLGKKRKRA